MWLFPRAQQSVVLTGHSSPTVSGAPGDPALLSDRETGPLHGTTYPSEHVMM